MIGGIELGGTKCVLAVANNPLDIIEKKIVPTRIPTVQYLTLNHFLEISRLTG